MIVVAILIPFIAAMFIPLLHKYFPKIHVGWFALTIPVLLFVGFISYAPALANGEIQSYTIHWIPSYGINFTAILDGLSMIFVLLISGIGSLVILYSIYYLSEKESLRHFYIYLLLFMGSMLGVVLSDNMMVLYVFWELTSISSFLLIAFWYHRKKSRYGAQKSLLITVSGGISMLVGFLMLFSMTGTFSIRETIASVDLIVGQPLFIPAMVLILLGAFTKSAQFPFHIWLPDAMEAPTPVSAYLHSATMVKAGIYLVARFTPIFAMGEAWFWIITIIGLMTLFWGSFTAIRQTDLKALLAYSTISQLGLVMSLLGMGSIALQLGYRTEMVLYSQATFAALFHLVNHSTFKGALFMVVGIVDLQVGTRDIRRLGGLMSILPITFTIALIGSFSMAGLPPFNGFLSKEMFFAAVLQIGSLDLFSWDAIGVVFPVVAWTASVFTFVYCMIIVFKTFLGQYKGEKVQKQDIEPPVGMLIAPSVLGLLVIGIFLFPNVIGTYLLKPAMVNIYPGLADQLADHYTISAWHGFKPELWMTIGVVGIGILVYKLLKHWKGVYRLFPDQWSLDALYNHTLTHLENSSEKLTRSYMTGYLRGYLMYIYIFFIAVVGGVALFSGAISFDLSTDADIGVYEWIFVCIMLVAGIAILFAKSRLTAVLLNSVLGFSIAFFFVLFRAPDLALTQTIIETVTTALFLLCFYFLPEWKKEHITPMSKMLQIGISIATGLIFILIGLSVKSGRLFDSISNYFENAFELAGGNNIVNAILGDFRAFDTMLEVVVLFIAGIGVYALIKFKGEKRQDYEDQ